jgi:hypothetical protein
MLGCIPVLMGCVVSGVFVGEIEGLGVRQEPRQNKVGVTDVGTALTPGCGVGVGVWSTFFFR